MFRKKMFVSVCGVAFTLLFVFFSGSLLYAYTDQSTTERIIEENKANIDFVDVCMTNFFESKVDDFKNIYQMHFNAEVSYLQSDYKTAFKRIYKSQEKQVDLYSTLLEDFYLENSKDILDQLAPMIIKSKSARAKLYLTLGYRDRAVAMNYYTIGTASNPKLYSYKIFKFLESIKFARRAKRYGFLALFESQSNEMKTRIYNHLFEIEREDKNLFYNRFLEKSDDAFLEEIRKDFIDAERMARRQKLMGNGSGVKKEPKISGEKMENQPEVFEKKIEKRVRFKNEKRVASYLLNSEFEKADDIIRDYVNDFNFKIITATIEVLQTQAKGNGTKIDYQSFQVHHIDNHARYSKDSILETISGTVKVEDYVEKKADTPGMTKSPGNKEEKIKDPGKTPKVEPGKDKKDNAAK